MRKPRPDYIPSHHGYDQRGMEQGTRKRGPKQVWMAKDELDRQVTGDAFIRDTRRKTSTVFERISTHDHTSADPASQGRREQ